jgi:predicted Zn-dependent peptidase
VSREGPRWLSENSDARMIRLGRAELNTGEFVDRDEGLARLSQVTREAVQSIAEDLANEPLSAVVVGAVPEGMAESLEEPRVPRGAKARM